MRMLNAAANMLVANSKLTAAVVAGVMLLSFGPAANALTFSTSGAAEQFSLGDTLGTLSNFDTLQIIGNSGTIGPNTNQITLNTLKFTAGVNALVPAVYNNLFSFTESVTIDNGTGGKGTGTLVVPFNLSINVSDILTIVGGTKLSIPVGSNIWNIVVNPLTIGPNFGGTETVSLTAQISDPPSATPLPAALVLFGSGLGAMGLFFGRRRNQRVSAA